MLTLMLALTIVLTLTLGRCFFYLRFPISQKLEIGKRVFSLGQFFQHFVNFDLSVNAKRAGAQREKNDEQIDTIPKRFEVGTFMNANFENFLDAIVENKDHVDDFGGEEKVVEVVLESQQIDRAERARRDDTPSRWHFSNQFDHAKKVNVRVVYCKVDKDGAGSSVDPQVFA